MVKFKKIVSLIFLLLITSFLSGCSVSLSGGGETSSAYNGGIFKSEKSGDVWTAKNLIPTITGRPKNFGSVDIYSLAMDPSDSQTIYAGSIDNGLFYTYDGGGTWSLAYSLEKVSVTAIAVDPLNKCIIYTAVGNKVYKSDDCSRTWSLVYFDNDLKERIWSIAIDHYDSRNIYIGNTRGDIIKSIDQGSSWKPINRFEDSVQKIIISPHDSRVIFVGTGSAGIFRSMNGGQSWVDLSDNLKSADKNVSFEFRDIVMTPAANGNVFLATRYGMFKSENNGNSWSKITLITPEKDAIINALAVSPADVEKIYYVTNTTFYRSIDGGSTWTTKKMPTTRAGWRLLIDFNKPDTIYLGVRTIK